jgi:protein transport protein SEC24
MQLVEMALAVLPQMAKSNPTSDCALGPAMKVARALLGSIGGRVSMFLSSMPNVGEGSLSAREPPYVFSEFH